MSYPLFVVIPILYHKQFRSSIGTEELAHVEIISAILYQLTRKLSIDQIKACGFDTYFVDHTTGVYPQSASGVPFTAAYLQSKGDIITDLNEDLAAEQKARTTYDNILRLTDDPDVREPIKFLRAREIVHYQRFSEALGIAQDRADCKTNFYLTNPSFDKNCKPECPTSALPLTKSLDNTVTGMSYRCTQINDFNIKKPY